MEEVMEAEQPTIQPQEPIVEYIAVEEGESSALDDVFDMLFELVDKKCSKE
jgi:hypothetical protein